jgi:acid phosphatase family membrane protein YuiD
MQQHSIFLWLGPLIAMVIAQVLKPLVNMLRLRRFDWKSVRKSGGMPSSHTALVVALVTELWMREGVSDPVLAISVFVAAIVMYDAAGVRWQTGRHAAVLNRLLRDLNGQTMISNRVGEKGHPRSSAAVEQPQLTHAASLQHVSGPHAHFERATESHMKKVRPLSVAKAPWWLVDWPVLDESVGHKPIEVVGGCVVGFLVALVLH